MDIVVLAKWVPVTQEEELKIIEEGKRINLEDIPYHLNEWDTYALEEAARLLKEKGGTGWGVELAKLFNRPLSLYDQLVTEHEEKSISKEHIELPSLRYLTLHLRGPD